MGRARDTLIKDGQLATLTGRYFADGPFSSVSPPRPEDRRHGEASDYTPDNEIRLEGIPPHPDGILNGDWVSVTGIWVERSIRVHDISRCPADLSLIDGPSQTPGAPVYQGLDAEAIHGHFFDRYRRWDLLMVAPARIGLPGPVISVAAVRMLPEIAEYLEQLPAGAVDFRSWLKPLDGTC